MFGTHWLLSLKLSSLIDPEREGSLGKGLKTPALQEDSAGSKAQFHRQLVYLHPELLKEEMVVVIALFS